MLASFQLLPNLYGLPPWLSGNESAGKAGATGDGFDPRVGKIPGRRAWKLTLVFLPGETHGQRNWWVTVHRVAQFDTTEVTQCTHTHIHMLTF